MSKSLARLTFSILFLIPHLIAAGPTGGEVVGGQGSIEYNGNQTTIQQDSQRMAIDWQTYNLSESERVQYLQPGSSAVSLNRIFDQNPSQIFGQIDANGIVFLVNPRGVLFGKSATLNVGSLVASGLDIKTSDFMQGRYLFKGVDGTGGAVVNQGLIQASTGGSVALLGKTVVNEGEIYATLGRVSLSAGSAAVITFDADGLIGVEVTQEVLENELGIDSAVFNKGRLEAEGGQVLMTAKVGQDLFTNAVNNEGIVQATTIEHKNGSIFLVGSGGDTSNSGTLDVSATESGDSGGEVTVQGENVNNSGTINADAEQGDGGTIALDSNDTTSLSENSETSARSESNGQGGTILVLGDKVGLFDQSTVDASGADGGGTVLIGGDEQGLNPGVKNATAIYLGEETSVKADGLENGDGGKVITFAEGSAKIYGSLSAQGGSVSGNGGFVETSGKEFFQIVGAPSVGAQNGTGGTWLIDPYNITINDTTANITTASPFEANDEFGGAPTLNVGDLRNALDNGATVIVRTTTQAANTPVGTDAGNITLDAELNYDGMESGTLQLEADNNITINAHIRDRNRTNNGRQDSLNLDFTATNGAVTLASDVIIHTNGGEFISESSSFNSSAGSITTTGQRNRNGGKVDIRTTAGDLTTGLISTRGGTARNGAGRHGGDIDLLAADNFSINVVGEMNTSGRRGEEDGASEIGGNAGNITLTTTGTGTVSIERVFMNGGHGDENSGGDLTIGGNGGDLTISAQTGRITLNGDIEAKSGLNDTPPSPPQQDLTFYNGEGGSVSITGDDIFLGADISIDIGPTRKTTREADYDDINLQGPISGGNQLTLNAGAGSISLDQVTIDTLILGSAGNSYDSVNTQTGDAVDVGLRLNGDITLNGSFDTTTNIAGNISVDQDVIVTANNGVTMGNGTSDIILEGGSLTVDTVGGGDIEFQGDVLNQADYSLDLAAGAGSISLDVVNVNTLTLNSAGGGLSLNGNVTLGDAFTTEFVAGDISINENITISATGQDITLGNMDLNNTLIVTTGTNDAGNINLNGTVNGGYNLMLTSGSGAVTVSNGLGDTDSLGTVRITNGGDATINGDVRASNFIQNGDGQVLLAADTDTLFETSGGNITFNGRVTNNGGNSTLNLDTGGGNIFVVDMNIADLSLSNVNDFTITNGAVNVANGFDATDISGALVADSGTSSITTNNSAIDLNVVNGPGALSLDAGDANINLYGFVGGNTTLSRFDATGSTIYISDNLNITATDQSYTGLISTGDFNFRIISTRYELGGDITSTSGDIRLDGIGRSDSTTVRSITTSGQIYQDGSLTAAGDVIFTGGQITQTGTSSVTAAGDVTFVADGNVSLSRIDASDIRITSTNGAITDNNSDTRNLSGNSATLNAQGGIGSGNSLETSVNSITVNNYGGGLIGIENTGNLTIAGASNTGGINISTTGSIAQTGAITSTSGNIDLTAGVNYSQRANITAGNNVTLTANNGLVSMNDGTTTALTTPGGTISYTATGDVIISTLDSIYNEGTVNISATNWGSDILSSRPGPDRRRPNIIGKDALLSAPGGSIGTLYNPLVIRVSNRVSINALSSGPTIYIDGPNIIEDSSRALFSGNELRAEVGNNQRTEVDALAIIDPAIFTEVKNFAEDDYPVKLPADQLFAEDEEEEEKKKRRNEEDPDVFETQTPEGAEEVSEATGVE